MMTVQFGVLFGLCPCVWSLHRAALPPRGFATQTAGMKPEDRKLEDQKPEEQKERTASGSNAAVSATGDSDEPGATPRTCHSNKPYLVQTTRLVTVPLPGVLQVFR